VRLLGALATRREHRAQVMMLRELPAGADLRRWQLQLGCARDRVLRRDPDLIDGLGRVEVRLLRRRPQSGTASVLMD
jgi:hypothetical protein